MGTTLTGKKIKDTYKSLVKVSDSTEAGSTAKQLSDGDGNDLGLYIDTDGVFGIGAPASFTLDVSSANDGVALPVGTTANRPTGSAGIIRYNSTLGKLEYYDSAFKQIASESYVNTQIDAVLDSAPGTLDTLNELAAALNDDANFYTTITNLINAKQNILTAGTGIDITSDTISTDLTGGTGIDITGDTISTDLTGGTGISISGATITNGMTAGTGISITGAQISADLSGLVDTGAIQGDAVTAPKIAQFDDNLSAAVAGSLMVSNGTDFTDVAMSGDVTISSAGATTIGADTIDGTNIADDAIDSEHITDGSIDESHLNATNTPTDNYVLSYDSASSGFTWVESSGGGGATTFVVNSFDGDGSTVAFTLTNTIADENNLQVYIDGVYQSKSNYSTSGQVLTFSTAPATGTDNIEVTHAVAVGGTPSIEVDTFNGDDSTVAFTLTTEPATKNNLQIYIDGVYQAKANYSTSGTTLTFTTAPPTGTNNIEVTHIKLS